MLLDLEASGAICIEPLGDSEERELRECLGVWVWVPTVASSFCGDEKTLAVLFLKALRVLTLSPVFHDLVGKGQSFQESKS